MAAEAEIAVVGAGIVGLCTAYALSERGASVAVYERGVPGNSQSGGESRIFRHAHDDRRLVALACEARGIWREWEQRFARELLSRDGVVSLGPAVERRLAAIEAAGGIWAALVDEPERAARLPILAPASGPAIFDADGGVIRVRAIIEELTGALASRLVFDEVMSLRITPAGSVELRGGGAAREYDRVVLCAGRETAALARGAGLSLPVQQSIHARLSYRLRGEPPERLACLIDGSGDFGESGAYADPLPGNRVYAVGLDETPIRDDGSVIDVAWLADAMRRTTAYVSRALPGLEPQPVDVRHCWVTELPWGPDGIAVWEASGLLAIAGSNLFKHAPALGRMLARTALGEGLALDLRAGAELGAKYPVSDPDHRVEDASSRTGSVNAS